MLTALDALLNGGSKMVKTEKRGSVRGCLHWAGLWACLWVIILVKLVDMGRPNPLWVAPFPRQGCMCPKLYKIAELR